jgi:hypothetical protein
VVIPGSGERMMFPAEENGSMHHCKTAGLRDTSGENSIARAPGFTEILSFKRKAMPGGLAVLRIVQLDNLTTSYSLLHYLLPG